MKNIELNEHYKQLAKVHMRDLFKQDNDRFKKFSLNAADLWLDFSKNRITSETIDLLCDLAEKVKLDAYIEKMFNGEKINTTENRAVLHTALRDPGQNIKPEIQTILAKMLEAAENIRHGPYKNIVNIGIGGSDLGPAMVTEALAPYKTANIKLHFVSNVDGTEIAETLKYLDPETTLFIVASKTFTTQETLCNANTAKEWLEQKISVKNILKDHMLAVTANPERAIEFGIDEKNIYPFWDWVGGRYSLWSAIGLPIAIAIGAEKFKELLAGAHAMDQHFRETDFPHNMPVIMGLLGIWNINFFNTKSHAVLPYDQYLYLLPAYLQQLEMESNGKRITISGNPVSYPTAPIIWGSVGTNGQHAFHQLLLQGTQTVPVDFIIPLHSHNPIGQHHKLLFANCLAQSQALMQGKTESEIMHELLNQGLNKTEAQKLAPHKVIPGNIPSNTILMEKVTPFTLGSLIALYEHKVFVQGVIWGINSFDQWGVELGKKLAKNIIPSLEKGTDLNKFDSSTRGLINIFIR